MTYSNGDALKDLAVLNGLVSIFKNSEECQKQFVSIQHGVEGVDDIPASKCPALRVAFDAANIDVPTAGTVFEEVSAQYVIGILIKGQQPHEREEKLIRCWNAVRIALTDHTLGGAVAEGYINVPSIERTSGDADAPYDSVTMQIVIGYNKNPQTGA